ncbi:transcription elongation factor GreA [Candidatus Uhrbacteria bacterium]|nr:transcription elongation factor GreA [Candidatus Uhrbacteria bacterium]
MPSYLSSKGLEEIKQELERRQKITRREIAEKIAGAKELGDLSENFEYQEAKEEQGMNEARIAQLENQIHDVVVIDVSRGASSIGIGTMFIAQVNGEKRSFTMVGSNEANPLEGKISNESPIGLAFLGAREGDTVSIEVPSGTMKYKIVEIH